MTCDRWPLDYAYYPHILETVVLYASPRTLLALRQTCKSVKQVCDKRLPVHAQLNGPLTYIASPNERPIRSPVPLHQGSAAVRVLDLKQPIESWFADYTGFGTVTRFDNARTVRRIDFGRHRQVQRWLAQPWRLVLFIGSRSGDDICPVVIHDRTRRVVIHFHHTCRPRLADSKPEQLEDLVLIVHTPAAAISAACFLTAIRIAGLTPRVVIVSPPGKCFRENVEACLSDPESPYADEWEELGVIDVKEILGRVHFLAWDAFRAESPHFLLETDQHYTLSKDELEACTADNLKAIEALGL